MSLPDIEATLPTLQQLMHQGVLLWTEAFIGKVRNLFPALSQLVSGPNKEVCAETGAMIPSSRV